MADQRPPQRKEFEMADDEQTVTLALILKQQGAMLIELRSMREDLEVTAATVRRMDGTMQGLVGEIRALTAQQSRLRQKVDG
jgi:uncharacterized protein YoxC